MFGLFANPSTQEIINMVKRARIEPFYEDGSYTMFLIYIEVSGKVIERLARNDASFVRSIVNIVDERINRNQFFDPVPWDSDIHFLRSQDGWKPNLSAKRALVSREKKPVFTWDP